MAAVAYLAGRSRQLRSLPEQVNQGQKVQSLRKLNEDPEGGSQGSGHLTAVSRCTSHLPPLGMRPTQQSKPRS